MGIFCIAVMGYFSADWIVSNRLLEKDPNSGQVNITKKLSTKLYLNWIFAGSFAGEAVAAKKAAKQNGIEIELKEGGQGLDPLKLVRDGQFGIASADEIIRAIEIGAPYVIVGVVNDDHPSAFVASKMSGIKSPKDFVGKRIGLLPFGSTGLVYKALLKKTGVDPLSLNEVTVYPDIVAFMSGRVNDVQPIFIFDETVSLDKEGFEYNLIVPKDYGVVFKGSSYFTTKNTLRDDPDLVSRFIASMIEGWQFAANNQSESINMLATFSPNIDQIREKELLSRALSFYVDGKRKPLDSDISTWIPFINELVEFGYLKNPLEIDQVINLKTVHNYYAK